MPAVFVDIWNGLVDHDKEAQHLAKALARKADRHASDDQDVWDQTHVRASAIEKLYTGCERVMARLAAEVDGASVVHADGWHVALLKRLAHPFANVREPVISEACYVGLDRLRAFRHRERNSYGIDLDTDLVFERAREAIATLDLFRRDVIVFMHQRGFDPGASP